jgi:hypothetical protein
MSNVRRPALAAVMTLALLLGVGAQQQRAAAAAAAASGSQNQVLQYVPGEALAVLKVGNLQQLSKKISKWANDVGLAAAVPPLADPLGAIKNELKIKQGLNENGDCAIVFVDPKAVGGNEEQAVLVLIPVSDFQGFLKNYPGAQTQGEVATFKPEGAPQEYFAAHWGNYAAVAMTKDLLAKKPAGLKLPAASMKEASARDAVLWANMPALREKALPHLKEAREQAMKEIEQNLANSNDPNAPKQFAPVAKALVNQGLNVVEGFLKDSDSALVSLNVSDDGIRLAGLSEFRQDSYSGKLAQGLKDTKAQLVSGLPDRKYFAVVGASTDSKALAQALGDLLNPIAKELANVKGGQQFADAVGAIQQSIMATKSITAGYVMPEGQLGQEGLIQAVSVAHGDAQKISQTTKQFLKGYAALFQNLPKEAGQINFNVQEKAQTVAGVQFDKFTMDMKVGDPAQQDQMKMVMGLVYGPGGPGGLMGVVDNNTFLSIQGGSDKLVADAVAAAKANKPNANILPGLPMVDKNLPDNRFLVEYVALDNIARTAVKAAEQFGVPFKMQLPADLPPLGFAAAAEGNAVRGDLFIPTKTVQSRVAAGMQAAMQMQGGQPGGQPGL